MTKIERLDAVLQGREPDRPPVSLWCHFGVQHMSGADYAKIALDYFHRYDFDFLKLMNDQYYPMPPGLEEIRTEKELGALTRLDPFRTDWKEQLRAVKIIAKELKKKAYFVDTVFDPWQTLARSICGESLPVLAKKTPRQIQRALNIVTDNLISYCMASLQSGANGIFLSVSAGKDQVDRRTFLDYIKPSVMKILMAVRSRAPMNVAHIHGKKIYASDVVDFPVPVLSWEDRIPGNPSLEEMKSRFPGVVMGGIDHNQVINRTRAFAKENAREGLRRGGKSRFILAGGCSIPSWAEPAALSAMVEAARAAGQTAP